jgi:hypothetical protein
VASSSILGVILLLLTSQSLTFINLTGSIVYALTVPMAAIALTLYWFDLQIRPAPSRSRWMRSPAPSRSRWMRSPAPSRSRWMRSPAAASQL